MCGSNEACLDDGVTGFLVEPRNPPALADRILTLPGNQDLARRMGMAGRARVVKEFRFDAMVARIIGLYEVLVRRPAA
jgi:glycosyltransferase involved in cell wall biosynthesis